MDGVPQEVVTMQVQSEAEKSLRPDQVRAMAHGLYHLAMVDGVTATEKKLISDFLEEGDVRLEVDSLANIPFSLDELLYSLDTVYLRKVFLRVCVLMAKADGHVSEEELSALRRISQAMGIEEPFDSLISDLDEKSL
jgi:hypothetical protein